MLIHLLVQGCILPQYRWELHKVKTESSTLTCDCEEELGSK